MMERQQKAFFRALAVRSHQRREPLDWSNKSAHNWLSCQIYCRRDWVPEMRRDTTDQDFLLGFFGKAVCTPLEY